MKTTEKIKVMQAYLDGKQIEIYSSDKWCEWIGPCEPLWDWDHLDYRIKPEPKYRLFKDAEELTTAIKEHRNILKLKSRANYIILQEWNDEYVWTSATSLSFGEVFDMYTFADGTPFGVKEE